MVKVFISFSLSLLHWKLFSKENTKFSFYKKIYFKKSTESSTKIHAAKAAENSKSLYGWKTKLSTIFQIGAGVHKGLDECSLILA